MFVVRRVSGSLSIEVSLHTATVPELPASVKTKLSMIDHRRDTNKFLLLKRNSFLTSVSKSISETGARIEWELCLLEELFRTVLQMIRILESYSWNVCSCKAVDTGKLWTEWKSVDSLYFAFEKKDQPRKWNHWARFCRLLQFTGVIADVNLESLFFHHLTFRSWRSFGIAWSYREHLKHSLMFQCF